MKKIKKLFAMLLALTMVLGMGVTTFAEGTVTGKKTDTGKITVNGIVPDTGSSFKVAAYKIVEPVYDQTTGLFTGSYAPVAALKDDLTLTPENKEKDGVKYQEISLTAEQMDAALKKIGSLSEIVLEDKTEVGTGENKTWNYYKDGVGVGTYLIVISGADTRIYNNMVVSVYYGNTGLAGGELTIIDGESTTKINEHPAPDKKVDSITSENNVSDKDAENRSAAIGDIINYSVDVDPIPYYSGEHPKLVLTDTLSKGLTLIDPTAKTDLSDGDVTAYVTVKVNDTAVPDGSYTATLADGSETGTHTLMVDFVVGPEGNKKYTLNSYAGEKAVVTYSVRLNENAAVDGAPNTNNVKLEYTKDSKKEGQDGTPTTDKTDTYTFDIGGTLSRGLFTKTGVDDKKDALGGAVFTLYTDVNCTKAYQRKNTEGTLVPLTATSDDTDGNILFKGLAEGTYYMKETQAPAGYSINADVFTIKIDANYDQTTKKLTSWEVTVNGSKVTDAKSAFTVTNDAGSLSGNLGKVTIPNTKLVTLPSTGGIGTTIFTVGGCAIMIIAAALYFATRRKAVK